MGWVLEANSASDGLGFPFDHPHLEFYQRLREAYPSLKALKAKGVSALPLPVLHRALKDAALKNLVARIEQKIVIFNQLREAMRIARPDGNQGLNDEGDGDIKTIESRVKAFRYSEAIQTLSASDISYQKMVKQIDKYWDKLFADPIQVDTPAGRVTIQPQRTNNLMEQSFRFLKRDGRKRNGTKGVGQSIDGNACRYPAGTQSRQPGLYDDSAEGKRQSGCTVCGHRHPAGSAGTNRKTVTDSENTPKTCADCSGYRTYPEKS